MSQVKIVVNIFFMMCGIFLGSFSFAQSSTFPSKPIKIIVPFTAGGPTDIYARIIAQKMQEHWGQPVLVDNRPGGTGVVGNTLVLQSPPDGYTLLFTSNSAHLISTLLKNPRPYDSVKDFTPISVAIKYPMYLLINPGLPVKTVPELIAYAKANPTKLNYSSVGIGSGGHLACELFNSAAGTNISHVPYKGAVPAQAALMAGETQMFCDSVGNSQAMVNAGRMRGLALFSDKRLTPVPEVPTLGEVGLKNMAAYIWLGLLGPGGMSTEVSNKLSTEVARIMALPEVKERVISGGSEVVANTPEEFTKEMIAEREIWSKVIKEKNIKAE